MPDSALRLALALAVLVTWTRTGPDGVYRSDTFPLNGRAIQFVGPGWRTMRTETGMYFSRHDEDGWSETWHIREPWTAKKPWVN